MIMIRSDVALSEPLTDESVPVFNRRSAALGLTITFTVW